jgi:photosystem II stability/assembly factor-like uncharacterized protein
VRRTALRGVAATAAALFLFGCESPGPRLEIPTPDPASYDAVTLRACFALSPEDCWVVGDLGMKDGGSEGLLALSENGGGKWRRFGGEHLDLRNVRPSCVHFIDRLRGWVGARRVTQDGVHRAIILRTYDGGGHWLEARLPTSDDLVIEDVHTLDFPTDFEGYVTVSARAPGENEAKETTFLTRDSGRSWIVGEFRLAPKHAPVERTTSFVPANPATGYRVRPSTRPGVYLCELTASGGSDWTAVAEFTPSHVRTWY